MLTTIPPTLHSPGRPRTPAQAPHQRLLALSPPPPPAAALPRRAGRPQLCAVAGATSGRPAPHPRHPHAALAAPQARPPAASAARLWGALSPPCGSRALGCPPGSPAPCPLPPPGSRAAVRRVSEEPVAASPVRRSRLGWAEPARARAQGARADEEGQGVRGVGSTAGRTGPRGRPRLWPHGAGRRHEGGKEDKERRRRRRALGPAYVWAARRRRPRPKEGVSRLPVGESNPGLPVTGGDTHHYTNEDGGGGRPGARPLSARARPPACLPAHAHPGPRRPAPVLPGARHVPRPRPTRPDPPAAASARTAVPRPDSERRAPDPPPPPPPSRAGMAAGEDARHGKQGCASEPEAPRRGWAAAAAGAAGARGPDAGSRSPLEAWVRIPLLTRPPFGPPNAGSPHPGLDDALSVPPYTPLRAAGCGLRLRLAAPWHTPARAEMPAAPRGPGHAPTEGRASLASSLSQPRPTPPPPARRERGVPTACPFRRPPFIPWSPPPPSPGAHEAWPPGGLTTATRPPGGQPSPPRASQRRDPRPVRWAWPGGAGWGPPRRGGSGSPERKAALPPRAPSAPEAAAGPGLQDASALPHRAARQPASRRPLRPSAPAGLTPTAAQPAPTESSHTIRAPGPSRPPPARTARAGEPSAHGPSGGAGREGKVRAELRRPQTPRAAWESGAGQAWPGCSSRQDSVWRRPRPRERAQGEPSPPRGLAGTVGAARRPEPEPEPEPEPSAHLHGRGACLADRGPAAPPRRVLTTGRAGTTTSAAGEAVWWPPPPPRDALYGHLAAVSFKHGPLPTAKVTASTRSMQPSQHRRQHTQPRGTAPPPPRLSPARRVHERRRTSMGITAKGTEVTSPPRPASTTPAALGPPPTPRTTIPTPAPAPAPAPGLPPPCQKQLYQQQQQQQQQQQRDVPTASRPA
ncbi:basic proline-rich protein-like [Canis lupus familiaris]|uniref:basic proline-rich protein-like n=1 Tax=Canis lupus familiaris TaxID=9615 RepID=UPI0018F29AD6|nr:basic proline-rich protein-like [Canis lupus familiaris]